MIYIFLPAYNEQDALTPVVQKFDGVFQKSKQAYKVVVLDDGSSDRTAAVAQELSKKYPLELLRHEVNQGLGQTMADGLRHCAQKAGDEE